MNTVTNVQPDKFYCVFGFLEYDYILNKGYYIYFLNTKCTYALAVTL